VNADNSFFYWCLTNAHRRNTSTIDVYPIYRWLNLPEMNRQTLQFNPRGFASVSVFRTNRSESNRGHLPSLTMTVENNRHLYDIKSWTVCERVEQCFLNSLFQLWLKGFSTSISQRLPAYRCLEQRLYMLFFRKLSSYM